MIDRARRWRPTSAHAIAALALFLALGGSAVALRGKGTVRTDDIRRGAVTAKKIRNGAVNPFKTRIANLGVAAGEVSTTSSPPVTLAGGPSVTVFLPKGALVAVYADVELRRAGGTAADAAQVHLFEPSTFTNSPQILERTDNTFAFRRTSTGNTNGVASAINGGPLTFFAPPGRHTYTLRYSSTPGDTALFRNRRLWVAVLS